MDLEEDTEFLESTESSESIEMSVQQILPKESPKKSNNQTSIKEPSPFENFLRSNKFIIYPFILFLAVYVLFRPADLSFLQQPEIDEFCEEAEIQFEPYPHITDLDNEIGLEFLQEKVEQPQFDLEKTNALKFDPQTITLDIEQKFLKLKNEMSARVRESTIEMKKELESKENRINLIIFEKNDKINGRLENLMQQEKNNLRKIEDIYNRLSTLENDFLQSLRIQNELNFKIENDIFAVIKSVNVSSENMDSLKTKISENSDLYVVEKSELSETLNDQMNEISGLKNSISQMLRNQEIEEGIINLPEIDMHEGKAS